MHHKIRREITNENASSRHRIPNLLRKYRRARGLKQKEVAKLLKFKDQSGISRWEKGHCLPSAMNLFRLAVLYRVFMFDALFPDLIQALKDEIKVQEDEFFCQKSKIKSAA